MSIIDDFINSGGFDTAMQDAIDKLSKSGVQTEEKPQQDIDIDQNKRGVQDMTFADYDLFVPIKGRI